MADEYDPNTDFYAILGLTAPTSSRAVQEAYLRQIEQFRASGADSEDKRQELEAARYHLSDVVRRAAYDKLRETHQRARRSVGAGPGVQTGSPGAMCPPAALAQPGSGRITGYEPASPQGLAEIEEQIRSAPEDLDALSWLAFQYYTAGELEKSATAYERYLQQCPDDADAHYYRARALQRSGRPSEARAHFRRVVELVPGTDRAAKAAASLRDTEDTR